MYQNIRKLLKAESKQFKHISIERRAILQQLSVFMQQKYKKNAPINLVFICTHNSRRSHFGQIAAALAAEYYSIDQVNVFSGGTETTAFHPNAIKAVESKGLNVLKVDENSHNPTWKVVFGANSNTTCFSKTFDSPTNPKKGFAAIMTCSDAEANCPYVPGVELRLGITYTDPKASDGTPLQDAVYQERFVQILREVLYTFSLVK